MPRSQPTTPLASPSLIMATDGPSPFGSSISSPIPKPTATSSSTSALPFFPNEIIENIISNLSHRERCRTIKLVSKRCHLIASNSQFGIHSRLQSYHRELIFSYLPFLHLHTSIKLVSTDFNHIIRNPCTPALQAHLGNAPPIQQPLPPGSKLQINEQFLFASGAYAGEQEGGDYIPWRNLLLPYDELLSGPFANELPLLHQRPVMGIDITYPSVTEAILHFHGSEKWISVGTTGLQKSRGLTIGDVVRGFVELFQETRGRESMLKFLRSSMCVPLTKEQEGMDLYMLSNYNSGEAPSPPTTTVERRMGDQGQGGPEKRLLDLDKVSIAQFLDFEGCIWWWDRLRVVVGREDGRVRFVLGAVELHLHDGDSSETLCDWVFPDVRWVRKKRQRDYSDRWFDWAAMVGLAAMAAGLAVVICKMLSL